jgi:hypothetical protein
MTLSLNHDLSYTVCRGLLGSDAISQRHSKWNVLTAGLDPHFSGSVSFAILDRYACAQDNLLRDAIAKL